MRLLYVLPEYPPDYGGGIGTFYEALLPELVRQGHTVDVLLGSAFVHGGAPYEREGVNICPLETKRFYRFLDLLRHYSMVPEVQRHLAAAWAMHEQAEGTATYDAVEVVDWGLLFVPWVVEARVPAVVQMHGSTGQIDFRDPSPAGALQGHLARLLEAGLLRGADVLQTYSTANQREWAEVTGREVAYLPPPLESGDEPEARPRGAEGLVVGRVQKWKGPTVLCEALEQLGSAAPHVKWVGRDTVFGESGSSMSEHLRATYPAVWGEKVEPVGQVPPAEVARLQVEAGFVVVPSLWDVYNLTAVEAMRHGAILVCSTGAGASDLVEDGVNGFTFPAGAAAALAASLQRVLALTSQERAALSAAARATVVDRLSPQTIAAQKVEAYEAAIRRAGAVEPDPWTAAAARPSQSAGATLGFLDHQPLRDILSYTLRRTSARLNLPFRS
jgi:glycosyltransferase involved in cell wall biosynthesis